MAEYAIRVKRVYEAADERDGFRVLIDRLWPRGVKREGLLMDFWAKDAAPSAELRRVYHMDEDGFETFRTAYLLELAQNPAADNLAIECKNQLNRRNVTLIFASRNQFQNHALVLKEWLDARIGG